LGRLKKKKTERKEKEQCLNVQKKRVRRRGVKIQVKVDQEKRKSVTQVVRERSSHTEKTSFLGWTHSIKKARGGSSFKTEKGACGRQSGGEDETKVSRGGKNRKKRTSKHMSKQL